jgi:hypothetical protein
MNIYITLLYHIFYYTDKDKMLKEGKPIGGDGGSSFDDARDFGLIITGVDPHRCVSIELHWDRGGDNKLTSICFNYGKTNDKYYHVGKHRGRDRGKVESLDLNQDTFVLKPNDAIEKITVYVGRRQRFLWDPRTIPIVTGIQFYTVKGDVSNVFGSTVDTEETTEYFPGYTLAYAKGRAGLWIDKLQFVWLKTHQDRVASDEVADF